MNSVKYLLLSVSISILLLSCNSGDMTCTCEFTYLDYDVVSICTECEGTSEGTAFEEECITSDNVAQSVGGSCTLTID